jgi:hypothetical protein
MIRVSSWLATAAFQSLLRRKVDGVKAILLSKELIQQTQKGDDSRWDSVDIGNQSQVEMGSVPYPSL